MKRVKSSWLVTERNARFESWTEDDRKTDAAERRVCELEFNDLNIHLYLRLNYGTASEHLKYNAQTLYGALWCLWFSWGLTKAQNSIRTTSDLDQSRLTDNRSAENYRIGADTNPEYRIDASLLICILMHNFLWSIVIVCSLCRVIGKRGQSSKLVLPDMTVSLFQRHFRVVYARGHGSIPDKFDLLPGQNARTV